MEEIEEIIKNKKIKRWVFRAHLFLYLQEFFLIHDFHIYYS
jgi:hypothetical protein